MKRIIPLSLVVIISLFMVRCVEQKNEIEKLIYPVTAKVDTVDHYFGTDVPDPYRWLEDDQSEETAEWVKAQNAVTFGFLENIPYRKKIEDRLTAIWDYPKISAPFKAGGKWFTYKNDGLQNQSVIYIMDNYDKEGKEFLDPNKLSEDGTVSLSSFAVSDDGKYAGYGISRGGSDWSEFFVMDVESGKKLDDHIQWVKFSGMSWYQDGFFYSRYPAPAEGEALKGSNENSMVYYHKVGTDQSEDMLIYKDDAHPLWGFGAGVTEDEKYMLMYVTESTSGNALYFKSMEDENAEFNKVVEGFEHDYSALDHIDGKIYVITNDNAPKYKLIGIDVNNPSKENWIDIIPETENVLESISIVGGKLVAKYMKDARSEVKVFSLKGEFEHDVEFELGTVSGFGGKLEDTFTFYSLTSFTTPSIIYKYDIANNTSEEFRRSAIDFDPDLYESKQVFYESKDGTKIPMFITHKKGTKLDGTNPTLLYGYGGFNISLKPSFSITRLILLEQGGVLAVANLRGGGEYGEDWHEAGTLMNKQNVFDDFIAAAEYLIDEKYTSSDKLAIQGGSNGGLLVGAVTNQRPDLFKVAFPAVGVMDMLRYQYFTIGRYWSTDYGRSDESEEMFKYLYAYSPVHNVSAEKEYPAVMVTTADHDDRVVPAHSFKYIATLQEKYQGNSPVLIRIESKAGHGAGTPTTKIIEQYADFYSFMFKNMGIEPSY